jgi:integrase
MEPVKKVRNNLHIRSKLNIQKFIKKGCEVMPRFVKSISLSEELERISISQLIVRAKSLVKERTYSQVTTWNYNGRFKDLLRISAMYDTETLSEGFIAYYIKEGSQRNPKLACSSIQRKSLLNLIALAIGAAPIFVNDKAAVGIQTESFRQSLRIYETHLRGQGKSDATVNSYLRIAAKFLLYLEAIKKRNLVRVTANDIRGFATELGAVWSPRSMRIVSSHLKAYLEFAGLPAEVVLFSSFFTPRKSKPVRAMSFENVEALWGYVESDGGDQRSKAILAILLSTGMRPVDITKLQIGDIDWNNESINFTQSKTGVGMSIRLFPAIGSSIARYITQQRPRGTGSGYVFLTKKAPFRKISGSLCNYILIDAFEKIGVPFVADGLHCPRAVRRSLVSRMIDIGVPIQRAAASIGHVDEKSIDLYAELDVKKMRSICLPVPPAMKGWCILND